MIFPLVGFTKAQVVDYYIKAASYVLPHLRDRCVSLKRYPDQAGGDFFWEKDAPAFTPKWVRTHGVWRRSGESQIRYIVVDNLRSLAWAVAMSALEFHPFLARIDDVERPTSVVFDLDPGEPAGILECARVALLLRDVASRLQLETFAKVSGSKGIQVYIPLNSPATYGDTLTFSRAVATYLARQLPDLVVSEMERRQRHGKVFVDWSQNADYKTTVSVYSLRAKRRHPYVSMPVRWHELEAALRDKDGAALYFSPNRALDRLRESGDLFAPVLSLRQELPDAFESATVKHRIGMPRRASAGANKLLHMPGPSSQGGRRTFSLIKHSRENAVELRLQLPEGQRCWRLARALPPREGQSVEAEIINSKYSAYGDDAHQLTGTFELIEGSMKAGYLDIFLTANKVEGEWLLSVSPDDEDTWTVRRPRKKESGLYFAWGPQNGAEKAAIQPQKTGARDEVAHAEVIPWSTDANVDLERLPTAAPAFVVPMECRLTAEVPNGAQWMYELKLDGYRAVAVKQAGVDLLSRYGRSFASRFPGILAALGRMELPPCVLDGEVVALDDQGRPAFQELQNNRSTRQPIVYYVFDILNSEGRDLRGLPLADRRKLLERLAKDFVEPVRLAAALNASASEVVSQVRRFGLEGVVAKRRDSIYESGKRPGSWVKYRVNQREQFVIGGYRPAGTTFDALLVGRFQGDHLIFVEKVKNGFVPATRNQVFEAVQDLVVPTCPFANLPERSKRRAAVDVEEMKLCVWLRPVQQCEVDFVEWTRGGHLRHPSFRELADRLSGSAHGRFTPKQVV